MLWSPGPLLPKDHIGLHLLLGQLPRVESGWGTAHSNSTPTPNCVPDDPPSLSPPPVFSGVTAPGSPNAERKAMPAVEPPHVPRVERCVDRLRASVHSLRSEGHASGLLASAKQYTQMDRAPMQTFDVHDGLDATMTMLSHKIGDDVKVIREYDRSLPRMVAYPAELNQVWTNLIDNAIDAMDGRGTLTVRTRASGDRLAVEIGDTGPGIPTEIRSRIFEPFFTTKDIGKGTGFGLDIAWRIVVGRHRGEMSVESEPGDTRFTVALPVHPPEGEE